VDWAEFEEAETAEGRAESKRWGKEAAGGSVDEYGGKRNAFFAQFMLKMSSLCQDRLGTNIGMCKLTKESAAFC
jgi:hypothetical protein